MLIFSNCPTTRSLDSQNMVIRMNDQNVNISAFKSMMTFALLSFCKFDQVKIYINADTQFGLGLIFINQMRERENKIQQRSKQHIFPAFQIIKHYSTLEFPNIQ